MGKVNHIYPLPHAAARVVLTSEMLGYNARDYPEGFFPGTLEDLLRRSDVRPSYRAFLVPYAFDDRSYFRWVARILRRALARVEEPAEASLEVLKCLSAGEPVPAKLGRDHHRESMRIGGWSTRGLAWTVADYAAAVSLRPEHRGAARELLLAAALAADWFAASVENGGEASEAARAAEHVAQIADAIELMRQP